MASQPKHVVFGPEIADGTRICTSHNEETGEAELCTLTRHKPDGDDQSEEVRIEPCPDERASANTFHLYPKDHKPHKGPAWTSNPNFCKGWDRIFGDKVEDEGTLN